MASIDVKVIVSAIDNLSSTFKTMGKNINSSVGKSTKEMGGMATAGNSLKSTLSSLAIKAGVVGLAIGAVGAAIAGVAAAMRPFIAASIEMENAFLGLTRLAQRFGIDSGEATNAAKSLASDGLVSLTTAANGLQKLMTAGMGLDQAVELMIAYKDQAAFGRAATMSYDQAVNNLAESFYTENSMIGNLSGQTENYNIIIERGAALMGKSVSSLTAAEKAQAKYLGTLELGKLVQGDAAVMAETLGGRLESLKTKTNVLKAAIGDALTPMVSQLAEVMGETLTKAIGWVEDHMLQLTTTSTILGGALSVVLQAAVSLAQGVGDILSIAIGQDLPSALGAAGEGLVWFKIGILGVSTAVSMLIQIVIGAVAILFGAFKSIITFSIKPLEQAVVGAADRMFTTYAGAQMKMEEIAKDSANAQTNAYVKSTDKIVAASNNKSSKLQKDLEEETEKFEREMEKREVRFQEQMADMIMAHIDKRDSLIEDLDKENREYNKRMDERAADYKERMDEMVADHQEKVDDINSQALDEDTDFEENMGDKTRSYEENMEDMERSHHEKVEEIEKQLAREVAKGDEADQERIDDLKERLAEENEEYDLKVTRLEEAYKRETERLIAEHEKRALALQERLAKEEEEQAKALAKAKENMEKETAEIKATHEERTQAYQEKLDKEEEILGKHQAEVDAVKDKAVEDDITRLKRHYAEQKKEAEDDHKRKMADVKEKGAAEGAAYGGAIGGALGPELDKIETDMKNAGKTAGENFGAGIVEGAYNAGKGLVADFLRGIWEQISALNDMGQERMKQLLGLESVFDTYEPHATGGIVSGAIGEPMPILAHGGERVTPAGLSSGGGGDGISLTVNVGIYAGAETEKRNIARELYAALGQVAKAQDKTVQQLMGV